jgi:hypothetical protein
VLSVGQGDDAFTDGFGRRAAIRFLWDLKSDSPCCRIPCPSP